MRAEKIDVGSADLTKIDTRITAEGRVEVERLFSLDQPSLRALSHVLRHKGLWPKGFKWNFSSCETCAMGLASQLWHLDLERGYGHAMASSMGSSGVVLVSLFTIKGYVSVATPNGSKVTPEMVADKIDQYLASEVA